jgi:serpin B
MESESKYDYFENKDIQAISLNYKKDNMEALIILPKNDYDINSYIENFNQEEYNNILKSLTYKKVLIYLPKFELEFETMLSQLLQDLGMKLAFRNADFFNLFKEPEEKKNEINYNISEIIQKAYIKIDEKGTEAAAVTMITEFYGLKSIPEKKNIMDINHPFLFIIRNTNLPYKHDILFIAKIEELKDKGKIENESKSRSESKSKSRSRSRSRSNSKEE